MTKSEHLQQMETMDHLILLEFGKAMGGICIVPPVGNGIAFGFLFNVLTKGKGN